MCSLESIFGCAHERVLDCGAATVLGPFRGHQYPVQLGIEEEEHHKIVQWIGQSPELAGAKIFAANPYLPFVMGLDPEDKQVYRPLWNYRVAQPGNLVIWDAHFGPTNITYLWRH